MQYLTGLARPAIVESQGKVYTPLNLTRLDEEKEVDPIQVRSLSGLVDYVKSTFDHDRTLMIHVVSPTKVEVFDSLNDSNRRRVYIEAKAMLPSITFERFLDRERFNIQLQSCFVQTPQRDQVIKMISNIIEDESTNTVDNGLTQQVTMKKGVASVGIENIPNPVKLKPFRTFVEVSQPESDFILRLQKGPSAALYEADGSAWELNAMYAISTFLKEHLQEEIDQKTVYIID